MFGRQRESCYLSKELNAARVAYGSLRRHESSSVDLTVVAACVIVQKSHVLSLADYLALPGAKDEKAYEQVDVGEKEGDSRYIIALV